MRRLKLMVLAVGSAMVMLAGLAGPAGAEPNENARGRGASTGGLTTATIKQTVVRDNIGDIRGLEEVTENVVMAQNPNQPGVTPGEGGGGCVTC